MLLPRFDYPRRIQSPPNSTLAGNSVQIYGTSWPASPNSSSACCPAGVLSEFRAALILLVASSATGLSEGWSATWTMIWGLSHSMMVWPAAGRTTTLHGSSSPILRSASNAWCASRGGARAEHEVVVDVLAELVAQRGLHVDLGQHTEALGLERFADAGYRLRERDRCAGEGRSPLLSLSSCPLAARQPRMLAGSLSRFRSRAFMATRKLEPDMDRAAISGCRTRPTTGSKTPAAMGRARVL